MSWLKSTDVIGGLRTPSLNANKTMTEQNTPKKRRGKRKAKEVNETPIVAPEPIPTPAPEPEEEFVPVAEYAEPEFVEEVKTSPTTYANPGGEYIPNSFKRRRAERRASK